MWKCNKTNCPYHCSKWKVADENRCMCSDTEIYYDTNRDVWYCETFRKLLVEEKKFQVAYFGKEVVKL